MSKITYPYEIESDGGMRWVFTSNEVGELLNGDAFIEKAGPTCRQIVNAINGVGTKIAVMFWSGDSCTYHGPLREMPA